MGCDIHIYTEKKYTRNGKTKWVLADDIMVNESFYFYDDEINVYEIINCIRNRNYYLFGVLAGIRAEEFQFFKRKGIPDDMSEHIRKEYERWDTDGHSHSYLTLKELKEGLKELKNKYHEHHKDYIHIYYDMERIIRYMEERKKDRLFPLVKDEVSEEDIRIVFWFDN